MWVLYCILLYDLDRLQTIRLTILFDFLKVHDTTDFSMFYFTTLRHFKTKPCWYYSIILYDIYKCRHVSSILFHFMTLTDVAKLAPFYLFCDTYRHSHVNTILFIVFHFTTLTDYTVLLLPFSIDCSKVFILHTNNDFST